MRKIEAEKIQLLVSVIYKLDEFLSLLDVISSVSERALLNQSLFSILSLNIFIESLLE